MYSRLSLPLITFFLLLIAGLVAFSVYKWSGWFVPEVKQEELRDIAVAHSDFLLIEELPASSAGAKEESKTSSASSSLVAEVAPKKLIFVLDEQGLRRAYWNMYSELLPRLYSAEKHSQTLAQLDEIASAAETDKIFAGTQDSKWIGYAVGGEREAARAISFDYARSPQTLVEAMAWAMIANSIIPNDYYLYICEVAAGACNEALFLHSSDFALKLIRFYGFKTIY